MNILWNVIEQSCGTTLKLMSCLCLLHIFTQMIVMEMIMRLSLHIKRNAAAQLNVLDANRMMFYGLRHTGKKVWCNGRIYYTVSVEQTPGSLHLFLLLAKVDIYDNSLLWECCAKSQCSMNTNILTNNNTNKVKSRFPF